jgi:hypothetical protein
MVGPQGGHINMSMNFHGLDPSLVINALRLVLDGWKTFRTKSGQNEPERKVLEDAVNKAEGMSEEGADAEAVVSEVGKTLEKELGAVIKDDVLSRAASILAIARPFETEAFRYYDALWSALNGARQLCVTSNIFLLRARTVKKLQYLPMQNLSLALKDLFEETEVFKAFVTDPDVIECRVSKVQSSLTLGAECLSILVVIAVLRAYSIGGTFTESQTIELFLKPGMQVNRVGFRSLGRSVSLAPVDFEVLLLGKDFEALMQGILKDLSDYTAELSSEQEEFKEKFAPLLRAIDEAMGNTKPS